MHTPNTNNFTERQLDPKADPFYDSRLENAEWSIDGEPQRPQTPPPPPPKWEFERPEPSHVLSGWGMTLVKHHSYSVSSHIDINAKNPGVAKQLAAVIRDHLNGRDL